MSNNQKATGSYTVFDLMSSVAGAADPDSVQTNSTEYQELLATIRTMISEEHANTLNSVLTNPNARNILMPLILGYITDYVNSTNDVNININRTAEKIYQDMAGFGILTPFLSDSTVEEININAWNSIEILWSDHKKLLEDTFSTPQECVDIIKKMVRLGGVHIDYSQPVIDSFIGDGIRISATLPPVNADNTGATASIRKQTYKFVTREKYLEMGFATPKVWDFMDLAIKANISLGIAGSPGAGKTTMMTCLLRSFLNDKRVGNNRICLVEEAREIDLTMTEEINPSGGQPRMLSPVLQYNTTHGEHPVTQRRLIRHALRVNPQIIVPAEMRGEEAIEAVEAGLTGVQIVSSFHAWGAKDGYIRVQSMCQMGHGNTSESALLQMIIRAFPIMIFIKKDDDGVRRIHEIFEATGVEESRVIGNTLFKFIRRKVEENEDGRIIRIHGEFVQYDSISKNLRRMLIQNGAKKDVVDQYYFEGENPNHPEQYNDDDVEIITVYTNTNDSVEDEVTAEFITEDPVGENIEPETPVIIIGDTHEAETSAPEPEEEPCRGIKENEREEERNTESRNSAVPAPDEETSVEPAAEPNLPDTPNIESSTPAPANEPKKSAFEEGEKEDLFKIPRSKGFWGGISEGRRK